MTQPASRPSWRKPAGMLAILAIITVWAGLVVSTTPMIGALPILVQGVIYMVAGIIWIAPLRPLLIWMETGSFRAPPEV